MTSKVKILFLAANPVDVRSRLRLDEEIREIDEKISRGTLRNMVELASEWAVRTSDLQRVLLKHRPDIVHFSGHGRESEEIVVEDQNGHSKGVSPEALTDLFGILRDNIRIVVLNACYAEEQARSLSRNIDCTIGMSTAIGDNAAIIFSAHFYQSLAFGRSVKEAFQLAVNQIRLEGVDGADIPRLLPRDGLDADGLFIINQPCGAETTESEREGPPFVERGGKRNAAGFLCWLLASIAFSLIADISRRFLGNDGDWADSASAIAQPFLLTLTALAAVLTGASLLQPANPLAVKVARLAVGGAAFRPKKIVAMTAIALAIALTLRLSLPAFAHQINESGLSDYYQGNLSLARQSYKRALRLRPSYAQAHYNLAATYEDFHPRDAVKEYLLAIDNDAKLYPAYNNLARLWIKLGAYDDALALLSKAIESSPSDKRIKYSLYKNLGWANYASKRHEQAERFLRSAISIQEEKGGAAAHCLLALVLMEQHEPGVARECEDCVRFAPGEEDVEAEWLSDAKEFLIRGVVQ